VASLHFTKIIRTFKKEFTKISLTFFSSLNIL